MQPSESRTSVSPVWHAWRNPKVASRMAVLSQAVRVSRLRASQRWSSPTIATPESADAARAQNSVTPKSLKKMALIQSSNGGFSSQIW